MPRLFWTDKKDAALMSFVGIKTYEEIGNILGISASAARGRARKIKDEQKVRIKEDKEESRLCLCCMRFFNSLHIGNRMCTPCKNNI